MGVFAELPKFLILYFKKPKEVVFDRNMFFCVLAGEVLIFTVLFYMVWPTKSLSILPYIEYLAQYFLFGSLFLFEIYLTGEYLLAFLMVLGIIGLPAYGFVSNFMHSAYRTFFKTKMGYFLFSLSFPLLLCFWILVAPYIFGNHKEYFHVPFTTDNELNMLLYHAVKEGMPNLVRGLLENGADVNFEYWKGRKPHRWETPLTVSRHPKKRNSKEIEKILIHYGADINARIGGRKTSPPYLVYLVRGNDPRWDKIIELLIESSADVEAKDRNGKTYLDYLRERK